MVEMKEVRSGQFRYILKVQPTGFADRLGCGYKMREREE